MTAPLLKTLENIPAGVQRPGYERTAHGVGILHLGLGAFHRAHQALATDDALAAAGGDWRIIGANLRSRDVTDALARQDGLYTVLIRGEQTQARIIGAHADGIGADAAAVLRAACDPKIRILSLTISEKGYGIDRSAMDIDPDHAAIAADLANPDHPSGAVGLITAALARRRAAGVQPFAALSCDNLPDNGAVLRAGVLGFARRIDPGLADWIAQSVAFPSTMVDRITPATTPVTHADVERLTGHRDAACVETEIFTQWVVEDHFPQGRPAWEAGGVEFVSNVRAHEAMKLRMLNGTHSLLAYAGMMLGLTYVRDTAADAQLNALIRRHLAAAAATLTKSAGLDYDNYAAQLMQRFANPAIAHRTAQIGMDGSAKIPQRWFTPASEQLQNGQDNRPFAFATAVWAAWLADMAKRGETPDDPRGAELQAMARAAGEDDAALMRGLLDLPGLLPADLRVDEGFRTLVHQRIARIRRQGLREAMAAELAQ